MTGSFAYLFGDSMAKVGLAAIADPTRNGLNIFGYTLSGWTDVFIILCSFILRNDTISHCCLLRRKEIRKLKI